MNCKIQTPDVFPKQVGEHLFQIDCPDCIEGYCEVMDCKVGSASLCCGGCTKQIECETCDATGYVIVPCFILDELEQKCIDCKKEQEETSAIN